MFKEVISGSVSIGSAIALSMAFSLPVHAADCGGNGPGSIPCSCGDNVAENRTLISGKIRDPVLNVVCTGNALVMNIPGVVLNLGGGKLRGSGKAVGVLIKADNVSIKNGRIDKFGTGISTAPGTFTHGSLIEAVKPYYNVGDGVLLEGDNNELIASPARHNGKNGTTVIGNNNILRGHNNEYNGVHGFFVQGDGNQLIDNLASENRRGGNGMVVVGNRNTIEGSWITKLNTDGIVVAGNNNFLNANRVEKQKDDGIVVDGDSNVLTDNEATDNRGFGISVVGTGNGADSTGNRAAFIELKVHPEDPGCEIYGVATAPTCIRQ